jgi:hypothetical protein
MEYGLVYENMKVTFPFKSCTQKMSITDQFSNPVTQLDEWQVCAGHTIEM